MNVSFTVCINGWWELKKKVHVAHLNISSRENIIDEEGKEALGSEWMIRVVDYWIEWVWWYIQINKDSSSSGSLRRTDTWRNLWFHPHWSPAWDSCFYTPNCYLSVSLLLFLSAIQVMVPGLVIIIAEKKKKVAIEWIHITYNHQEWTTKIFFCHSFTMKMISVLIGCRESK